MYKARGPLGTEPTTDLRPKKLPKDLRKSFPAYPHEQPRGSSSHTKNELSKYKMSVSGRLLDYITELEQNIGETKAQIEIEQKMTVNLILNVSRFLGIYEVNEESIVKYLQELNDEDTQQLETLATTSSLDWFELLQQHRFKCYLYGGGSEEKVAPRPAYLPPEPIEEKRKYKKTYEDTAQHKRKKKSQLKKGIVIQPIPPQPILIKKSELEQTQPDYTKILKNILQNQEIDMNIVGGFQKYIHNDLPLKGLEQSEHIGKGE